MVTTEYGRVANFFIGRFWQSPVRKAALLKPVVDLPLSELEGGTWLNYSMRQTAAREAIGMITAAKERWGGRALMPVHKGERMRLSTGNVKIRDARTGSRFEVWACVTAGTKDGKRVNIDLPLCRHKHYRKIEGGSRRCGSFIVSQNEIVFAFEKEVGEPRNGPNIIGLDTGMKALATLSTGEQFGYGIKKVIDLVGTLPKGSRREQRLRRRLKQTMDAVAKRVASKRFDVVVVEDLTGISNIRKRKIRPNKEMRVAIGNWNWRYWMGRLRTALMLNCVRLEFVDPAYTSQTCHPCGHVEKSNRNGEKFRCRACGHVDNADINAAKIIRSRFVNGVQGPVAQEVKLNGVLLPT